MDNKKTNREKCIEMWEWLAENPDLDKGDYFTMKGINRMLRPNGYCYACQEVRDVYGNEASCGCCPIDWTGFGCGGGCQRQGSVYDAWEEGSASAQDVLGYIKRSWVEKGPVGVPDV